MYQVKQMINLAQFRLKIIKTTIKVLRHLKSIMKIKIHQMMILEKLTNMLEKTLKTLMRQMTIDLEVGDRIIVKDLLESQKLVLEIIMRDKDFQELIILRELMFSQVLFPLKVRMSGKLEVVLEEPHL